MKQYDAFISYRRSSGFYMAKSITSWLEERGLSVFLDIDQSNPGHFDDRIERAILNSKNLILLMTPDIFEGCRNKADDWIIRELEIANQAKIKVIPVAHRNFKWPEEYHEELNTVIKELKMVEWVCESFNYLDAMMDKLCEFLDDVKYSTGGVNRINFLKNHLEYDDKNVIRNVKEIEMAFHTGVVYMHNDEHALILKRIQESKIPTKILINDEKALSEGMLDCLKVYGIKYATVEECIEFWKQIAGDSDGLIKVKKISVPLFRRYYNIKDQTTGIMHMSYYTYGGFGLKIDFSKTLTAREKMYDNYQKEFEFLWERAETVGNV